MGKMESAVSPFPRFHGSIHCRIGITQPEIRSAGIWRSEFNRFGFIGVTLAAGAVASVGTIGFLGLMAPYAGLGR